MQNSNLSICWHPDITISYSSLVDHLRRFGDMLPKPLSGRLDLDDYAAKLHERADIALAYLNNRVVGLIALYANDLVTKACHIPLVAVDPETRRRGVGKALVLRALARARARGMTSANLNVLPSNGTAIALYRSFRFRVIRSNQDRLLMQVELPPVAEQKLLPETPLESRADLSAEFDLDIDLRVKRDDLYPLAGGGIKARKISYILSESIAREHDVVVTNGGPQSNHARATALEAARLGLKCHIVVVTEPGRSYRDAGNILLMRLTGATIEYCTKDRLAQTMERAMSAYVSQGHNPHYIWGGGHCLSGTQAFVDAASEARKQCSDWIPDYVVLASGTGSTQAGLALGYADLYTRVLGVSVAREAERGGAVVQECIDEYRSVNRDGNPSVEFFDDWIDGGYECASENLLEIISRTARHGFFVDPTYSGKAWHGLIDLVKKKGVIQLGSKVLFWHTGGLMNILASPLAGADISA